MSSIWTSECFSSLLKADETSVGFTLAEGLQIDHIPGRYADDGILQRGGSGASASGSPLGPGLGFAINWEKTVFEPSQSIKYNATVDLTPKAKLELEWWATCLPQWNGCTITPDSPDMLCHIHSSHSCNHDLPSGPSGPRQISQLYL